MLIVISPAKTLNFKSPKNIQDYTIPAFIKESSRLIKELQKYTPEDLSELMSVSPTIGRLNFERFHEWKTDINPENDKQAILAFNGNVYLGLKANTFNIEDFSFAQQHLRILSGLYGVLRPLDLMKAYRLEMGTHLKTRSYSNLYQFWDDKITNEINKQLREIKSKTLINLASAEYFKSIQLKNLKATVITPEFREDRDGKFEVISIYAKKARGLMSRFIIKNRLDDPEDIKHFEEEGYRFNDHLSKKPVWVFSR
jgi:uncharacterized protein